MTRGRPAVKRSIPRLLWRMVELTRDRKEWGRPRASVREATPRVAKELAECFQGGDRNLPAETVRRYHKEFERVMRRGGDEAEHAKRVLEITRQRRDLLGWDTSTWLLLADPWELSALGYKVVLTAK
jgi:hypothetical protein